MPLLYRCGTKDSDILHTSLPTHRNMIHQEQTEDPGCPGQEKIAGRRADCLIPSGTRGSMKPSEEYKEECK